MVLKIENKQNKVHWLEYTRPRPTYLLGTYLQTTIEYHFVLRNNLIIYSSLSNCFRTQCKQLNTGQMSVSMWSTHSSLKFNYIKKSSTIIDTYYVLIEKVGKSPITEGGY